MTLCQDGEAVYHCDDGVFQTVMSNPMKDILMCRDNIVLYHKRSTSLLVSRVLCANGNILCVLKRFLMKIWDFPANFTNFAEQ